MNKSYCPKCGKANIYTLESPEFCRFCNSELSFESLASNSTSTNSYSTTKKSKVKSKSRRVVEDEEYEDDEPLPELTSLAVEITDDRPKTSFNIQEITSQGQSRGSSFSRPAPKEQVSIDQLFKTTADKTVIDID